MHALGIEDVVKYDDQQGQDSRKHEPNDHLAAIWSTIDERLTGCKQHTPMPAISGSPCASGQAVQLWALYAGSDAGKTPVISSTLRRFG